MIFGGTLASVFDNHMTSEHRSPNHRNRHRSKCRNLAGLPENVRARIKRLAEQPWLSVAEIYNLLSLDDHDIGCRTFRSFVSKIRSNFGFRGGLRGPRTLKRRANVYALSLLCHLSANHSDEFVSALIRSLWELHFENYADQKVSKSCDSGGAV